LRCDLLTVDRIKAIIGLHFQVSFLPLVRGSGGIFASRPSSSSAADLSSSAPISRAFSMKPNGARLYGFCVSA
jgi:hypothetical protein